ncbi:MAG: excinuclease ABC subunit A, partial [Bacteroidales bacterium]|nr:excinuclease ABC subunit A [Bacteroidales bacterium]
MKDSIIIKNAHSHNLKGIDVEIPRGRMTVVTGISGSGKTSLAFDTLFAEGQRRYAQSLSSFARQFLGRMQKPAVDSITGLPPAIAIEQKVNTRNPRSTVGSVTEIYDYLRLLFARIGRTYSPISGVEVRCDSVASVENEMRELACGGVYREAYLLVPFGWQNPDCRQVEHLLSLKEEGYVRLFALDDAGGRRLKIDRVLQDVESVAGARVWLLLERVELASLGSEDAVSLLRDSLRLAFGRGDGHIALALFDAEGKPEIKEFSSLFEADGMSFQKPEEWLFNYNSPLGACKVCGGLGKTIGIDENLVVPNKALSIYQDAIACWRGEVMRYFKEEVILNAAACGIDIHCPWRDLPEEARRTVWQGNQYITGVLPFFGELEKKRYKIQNKYMITRYSGKTVCSECGGHRLCREALYVRVGGKDIAQLMAMSAAELLSFFEALKLDSHDRSVAERPIKEICQRLGFLNDVGLGYLTMERHANTLSGGESQRVHLVSSLGNSLTGSMYILDEPSIGLHERDTERLIKVLYQLRDLGNTVVVVEH